jgi:oligopeptidase B
MKKGDWYWSWRFDPGAQYRTWLRIPLADGPEGAPQITLDENALAEGHEFLAVRGVEADPGGRILAWGQDTDGSERFTIRFRDLETGADLPDAIPGTSGSFAWSTDRETLFYLKLDENQRPSSVWRHRLGTDAADDVLVYDEPDPGFFVGVGLSLDEAWITIACGNNETSEARLIPADTPEAEPRVVEPRHTGRLYDVEHAHGTLYILTDDTHSNRRLVTAPADAPGRDNWQELIAPSDDVYLEHHMLFRDHLVISEREAAVNHVRVRRLADGAEHRVDFPEPAYTVSLVGSREFDSGEIRLVYTSLVTPMTVFDYDMESREKTVRKVQEIPSGYDADRYVSERQWATSHDGAKVPVTIVRRRDTPVDGSAPLYLYAYGSYGATIDPYFSTNRISLLDRGFVWALAHPRGGADLGRRWYEDGRLEHKENTFRDMVAVAKHLAAENYTEEGRITLGGGSAGGLMVGATINLAPELFHAAAAHVPFVDVLNTMLDDTLWLTPGEYPEWGNPSDSAEVYRRIKGYSPYDNVEAKAYPHLYITGGLTDPRVTYWEAAKWLAKLRDLRTDDNLAVLRMNMGAGHGGASGRYEHLHEQAEEYAFLLMVYGMAPAS